MKILFVDDDLIFHETCSRIMKNEDCVDEIQFIATSSEAYTLLSSDHDIDLVFLDMHLPVMNGFELLEKLANANLQVIPKIIMLTSAYNNQEPNNTKASALVSDYLVKEVDISCMKKALISAINKSL